MNYELSEAKIVINGVELTPRQSMVMRVALTTFMIEMSAQPPSTINEGYMTELRTIMNHIQETKT